MENLHNNNIDTVFSVDEENISLETALQLSINFSVENNKPVILLYDNIYFYVNKITKIKSCIKRFYKVRSITNCQ